MPEVMGWHGLAPRRTGDARRLGSLLLCIPALVLIVIGVTALAQAKSWAWMADNGDPAVGSIAHSFAAPLILLALAAAFRFGPRKFVLSMAMPVAVAGIVFTCWLNISANDWTAGGMVFYALPVIFGAYVLRAFGALVVVGAALVTSWVNLWSLAVSEQFWTHWPALAVVLVAVNFSLSWARNSHIAAIEVVRSQSCRDALTNLNTRWVLDDTLSERLADGGERAEATLLLLDIDHFKTVNDNHGHLVGDQALQHVAQLVLNQVRSSDIACRLGGDELAVLLPKCSAATAQRRAVGLVQSVADNPLTLADGTEIPLTISVGIGRLPDHADHAESLYRAADSGLYQAKRLGRAQAAMATWTQTSPGTAVDEVSQ